MTTTASAFPSYSLELSPGQGLSMYPQDLWLRLGGSVKDEDGRPIPGRPAFGALTYSAGPFRVVAQNGTVNPGFTAAVSSHVDLGSDIAVSFGAIAPGGSLASDALVNSNWSPSAGSLTMPIKPGPGGYRVSYLRLGAPDPASEPIYTQSVANPMNLDYGMVLYTTGSYQQWNAANAIVSFLGESMTAVLRGSTVYSLSYTYSNTTSAFGQALPGPVTLTYNAGERFSLYQGSSTSVTAANQINVSLANNISVGAGISFGVFAGINLSVKFAPFELSMSNTSLSVKGPMSSVDLGDGSLSGLKSVSVGLSPIPAAFSVTAAKVFQALISTVTILLAAIQLGYPTVAVNIKPDSTSYTDQLDKIRTFYEAALIIYEVLELTQIIFGVVILFMNRASQVANIAFPQLVMSPVGALLQSGPTTFVLLSDAGLVFSSSVGIFSSGPIQTSMPAGLVSPFEAFMAGQSFAEANAPNNDVEGGDGNLEGEGNVGEGEGDDQQEGEGNNQQEGGNNNQQEGGGNNQQEGGGNNQQEGGNNNQQEGGNNQQEGGGNNQQEGGNNNQQEGGGNNQQEGGNNN